MFSLNNDGKTRVMPVKVFVGKKVAIVVDKNIAAMGSDLNIVDTDGKITYPILNIRSTNKDINYYAMAIVVDILDRIISKFLEMFGRIPSGPDYKGVHYRMETAYIDDGGYGSADYSLFLIGPAFFTEVFNSSVNYLKDNTSLPIVSHALPYEAFRQFCFPDQFTTYLDYRLYDIKDRGKSNPTISYWEWGWVNQGFVNCFGSLYLSTVTTPSLSFNYSEIGFPAFFQVFESTLDNYITGVADGMYTWQNTMMYNRLIWTGQGECLETGCAGLDNLYSAILIRLFKTQGGVTYITRLIKAIMKLGRPRYATTLINDAQPSKYVDSFTLEKTPAPGKSTFNTMLDSKLNMQTAAENYYIASSYGANKDLYTYFTVTLGAPIRQEARTYAINLIANNP
jgi:hypothetical protein